jgi:hypothetical protein
MTAGNASPVPTGRRSTALVALAVLMAVVWLSLDPGLAFANGGKGKRVVYRGTLRSGDAAGLDVQFEAEVEPLLFRLTGVGDRYRVMRIRVRNTGTQRLVLSASADTVEAIVRNGPPVRAVLDLGARDAPLWDGLAADLRRAIAYPSALEGGEEESVFVFLPASEFPDVPQGFRYTIASRPDRPVVITDVSAAVAR